MLVLSRREGEKIVIGEGAEKVTISISQFRGDKVRLAIEAPPDVPVHRQEIYEAMQQNGRIKK